MNGMGNMVQVTATKWINKNTVIMIDDNGNGTFKVTTSIIDPIVGGAGGGSHVFPAVAAVIVQNAFHELAPEPQEIVPIATNPPPPHM